MNADNQPADSEVSMVFEWDHTIDDQILVQAFIIEMINKSTFFKAQILRHRMMALILITTWLGWVLFSSGPDGLSTVILTMALAFVVLLALARALMGSYANSASFKKKAKRVVSYQRHLPLGKNQVSYADGMLEWIVFRDEETTTYPARLIEKVEEQDDRLYLCRDQKLKGSIPFHAFGDQQTRRAFIELIEKARNKSTHA